MLRRLACFCHHCFFASFLLLMLVVPPSGFYLLLVSSIPTGRMPAVLHVDIPDYYWLHLATVASTPIFSAMRLVSVAVRQAREIISRMR